MNFKPEAQLTPQQKATMIASLLLVDYMFFEQERPVPTLTPNPQGAACPYPYP